MNGPAPYRLSIGAFYGGERLGAVGAALDGGGFAAEDVGLLASQPILRHVLQSAPNPPFSALRIPQQPLRSASADQRERPPDDLDLAVAEGALLGALLDGNRLWLPEREVDAGDHWLSSGVHSPLAGHARNGAVLVIVGAATAIRHRTASRLLLAHTQHPVHTCELRVPKVP